MRTILKMMTIPLVMNKVVCAYILGADHLINKNKAAFREQLREYRCSLVKSIFLFLQVTQAVYTFATKAWMPRYLIDGHSPLPGSFVLSLSSRLCSWASTSLSFSGMGRPMCPAFAS